MSPARPFPRPRTVSLFPYTALTPFEPCLNHRFLRCITQPSQRRRQQQLSGFIVSYIGPFSSLTSVHPCSTDCICGEFIVGTLNLRLVSIWHAVCFLQLVIEKSLAELPKRQTDGAIVIRSQDSGNMKAVVFKLNANPVEPVLVERYELTLMT